MKRRPQTLHHRIFKSDSYHRKCGDFFEVSDAYVNVVNTDSHYAPHQCVRREPITTKHHTIFNVYKKGVKVSLIVNLVTKPKLYQHLSPFLVSFLKHKIVSRAYVAEFYHRGFSDKEERDFYSIFWQ